MNNIAVASLFLSFFVAPSRWSSDFSRDSTKARCRGSLRLLVVPSLRGRGPAIQIGVVPAIDPIRVAIDALEVLAEDLASRIGARCHRAVAAQLVGDVGQAQLRGGVGREERVHYHRGGSTRPPEPRLRVVGSGRLRAAPRCDWVL